MAFGKDSEVVCDTTLYIIKCNKNNLENDTKGNIHYRLSLSNQEWPWATLKLGDNNYHISFLLSLSIIHNGLRKSPEVIFIVLYPRAQQRVALLPCTSLQRFVFNELARCISLYLPLALGWPVLCIARESRTTKHKRTLKWKQLG